jgi:hypothetical protein
MQSSPMIAAKGGLGISPLVKGAGLGIHFPSSMAPIGGKDKMLYIHQSNTVGMGAFVGSNYYGGNYGNSPMYGGGMGKGGNGGIDPGYGDIPEGNPSDQLPSDRHHIITHEAYSSVPWNVIIGVGISLVALAALVGGVLYMIKKRSRKERELQEMAYEENRVAYENAAAMTSVHSEIPRNRGCDGDDEERGSIRTGTDDEWSFSTATTPIIDALNYPAEEHEKRMSAMTFESEISDIKEGSVVSFETEIEQADLSIRKPQVGIMEETLTLQQKVENLNSLESKHDIPETSDLTRADTIRKKARVTFNLPAEES